MRSLPLLVCAVVGALSLVAAAQQSGGPPASPELRAEAQSARDQAAAVLAEVSDRWTLVRGAGRFDRPQIARFERELDVQRARLPGAALPEMLTQAAAQERIAAERQVAQDLHDLSNRMAVSREGEVRGVWFHFYAAQDWDRICAKVKAAGLNAIFARVGRGGNVIYPNGILPLDAWAGGLPNDHLREAIDAAHKHGLQFHAWRVNFHMGSAPRDYYDQMAAEDRLVRDPQGKQEKWLNPGDPRNTEQEYQVMMDLVRRYDIDGLHLDYIRYPDDPHYDFDYGPVSRREFEAASGRPVDQWPADVIGGPRKREYEDWERSNVNGLVKRVSDSVRREKPQLLYSAAVWRNHRRYRAVIKQDWMMWAREGWLDFLVPMDYTPNLDTFAATVESQVAVTRGTIPLVAGIGNYLIQRPEDVVRAVEIARGEGADGFVLFALNHTDIDNQLAALKAGATRTDTWPATQGPQVEWAITDALAETDLPLATLAGDSIGVTATLRSRTLDVGRLQAAMSLENLDEQLLVHLGDVAGRGQPRFAALAPAGRFRPVLRGTYRELDGREALFVARGPVIEGLSSEQMAARRAQDEPPVTPDGRPAIGVFARGYGSETLAGELDAAQVYRLRPDHLAKLRTLVLPQLNDVEELSAEAERDLRRWVEGGGRLVLTHDAVGIRWHPRMFPEIGEGVGFSGRRQFVLTAALPPVDAGYLGEHSYVDHVRLKAGPQGTVIAREAGPDGEPVIVAGRVGQGTVVLNGMLPGYGARPMTHAEQVVLRRLAEIRLTR